MILTTSDAIAGREIAETIGLVRGNAARARGVGYDITAGIRNLFGGAVPEYSNLMTQSRDEATANMIASAQAQGADAIVAVRYTTSTISAGVSEILAFGTAVKLR
jgi:uncharacterized protein YbjQ (UPF0145 family)